MAIGIIVAVAIYGIVVFYVSNLAKKSGQSTTQDFYIAGRSATSIMMLGTVALSIWSALAFYGYGAGIYRNGVGYFSGIPGACLVGLYASTIMYRLWLLSKKYGYETPGDFMADRFYSPAYRWIVSLTCVIFVIPYISLQIIGVANGFEVVSSGKITFWVAVAILTVYILGHVLEGGSKSVVLADTVAGFSGVAILVISVIFMTKAILPGGLAEGTRIIMEKSPDFLRHTGPYSSWIGTLGLSFSAGIAIIAWPHIFVRSYMAKSAKVFLVMAAVFPLLETFAFSMFLIQAFLGRVAFPGLVGKAADNLVPMLALEYTPPIIAILLVVGVFAFGMSTADSQLLVASSIIQKDIYENGLSKKGSGSQKDKIKFSKIALVIMMVLVLLVVKYRPAVLVDYAYKFSSPGFAQLMPAMIAGLYWSRATKEGAIVGTLAGVATVIITLFFYNPVKIVHPILWGLAVNTLLLIVVSYLTPPPPKEVQERIHGYLNSIFEKRNNSTTKVLLVLLAIVFLQGHVLSPYLPDKIVLGWMPLGYFNYVIYAVELAVLTYLFAKNQIAEDLDEEVDASGKVQVSQ
ncbi:MAG: solute:Na+ symporter, family [Thermosediminibacterales bacterium]|nr:solute:Na+ symporter, family [Thermosediminibacterales bacterium]